MSQDHRTPLSRGRQVTGVPRKGGPALAPGSRVHPHPCCGPVPAASGPCCASQGQPLNLDRLCCLVGQTEPQGPHRF